MTAFATARPACAAGMRASQHMSVHVSVQHFREDQRTRLSGPRCRLDSGIARIASPFVGVSISALYRRRRRHAHRAGVERASTQNDRLSVRGCGLVIVVPSASAIVVPSGSAIIVLLASAIVVPSASAIVVLSASAIVVPSAL